VADNESRAEVDGGETHSLPFTIQAQQSFLYVTLVDQNTIYLLLLFGGRFPTPTISSFCFDDE
jgi:hypothetical protein